MVCSPPEVSSPPTTMYLLSTLFSPAPLPPWNPFSRGITLLTDTHSLENGLSVVRFCCVFVLCVGSGCRWREIRFTESDSSLSPLSHTFQCLLLPRHPPPCPPHTSIHLHADRAPLPIQTMPLAPPSLLCPPSRKGDLGGMLAKGPGSEDSPASSPPLAHHPSCFRLIPTLTLS